MSENLSYVLLFAVLFNIAVSVWIVSGINRLGWRMKNRG